MFIAWQIKKKVVKRKLVPRIACLCCNEKGKSYLNITERFIQLYWFIPLFPLPKKAVLYCDNCKNETKSKYFLDSLEIEADNLKREIGVNWFHFSGLVVILLICSGLYHLWKYDEAENFQYFQYPQVGDIYKFQTENNDFSSFKIVSVESDSLKIRFSKTEVSRRKYIKQTFDFQTQTKKISRKELKNWLDSGKLYAIDRADFQPKNNPKENH